MRRIMYFSAARDVFSPEKLDGLLAVSRRNNLRDGVTGLLMYHDGSFLQVLEAEAQVLDACYRRIERDPSHCGLLKILDSQVDGRLFGDWSMGFARPEDLSRQDDKAVTAMHQIIRDLPRIAGTDRRVATLMKTFFRSFPDYAHKIA